MDALHQSLLERRIRLESLGRARIERWCAAAVNTVTGLGIFAALLSIATTIGLGPLPFLWLVCCLALVFLPVGQVLHERRRELAGRGSRVPDALLMGAQVIVFLILCSQGPLEAMLIPASFLAIQGVLAARSRLDAWASMAVLVGVLQVGAAAAQTHNPALLALFAMQLAAAIAALILVHGRETRRRVALGAFRRREVPDESRAALARRLGYALPLALGVLLAALCLHDLARPAAGPTGSSGRGDGGSGSGRSLAETYPEGLGGAGEDGGAGDFPEGLDYGETVDGLSPTPILEVRARYQDGPWQRFSDEWLLKGLNLDTFTDEGVVLRDIALAREQRDPEDGRQDGWCALRESRLPRILFEITQAPMTVGARRLAPLFRAEPVAEVQLDAVNWEPSGVLTTTSPPAGLLRYTVTTLERDLGPRRLRGARARHADPRYLQLPRASEELDWLRTRALEIGSGPARDSEKVQRVIDHFTRGYRYSFEGTGFAGLASVVEFMNKREGFCTYYASSAALLLRLLDVPTRVATGYRVDEFDEELSAYVVRSRDGHAWIEVHYEGIGWVPYDPTPPTLVDDALTELLGGVGDPDLARWHDQLRAALQDWREGRGFGDLFDVLHDLPAALAGSLGGRSTLWLLPLALTSVLALAWLLRRRFGRALRRAGLRTRAEARAETWYHRLLRSLARSGLRKRPGQTPREFAAQARARVGEPLEALESVTELYYRERFGGLELGEQERRTVEEFLREVRRLPRSAVSG